MNTNLAVMIVAREVLSRYAADCDAWQDFPEIGENDWEWITRCMRELAPAVPRDDYLAAYAYLEDRAAGEAS